MKASFKMGRLGGRHVGRVAQPVWVCARPGCEVPHQQKPRPANCIKCGGIDFDYFPSAGEAGQWAALRLQEKIGKISNLRRQVRFKLMAPGPNGMIAHVADYIADFTYTRDGELVVAEHKSKGGMDDVARLKLKWLEAQMGKPITLTTS